MMDGRDPLRDAFTGNGTLVSHWEASGVKTTYDKTTKELHFELPAGWTDLMSAETRAKRTEEWAKIDDPTYNVEYRLTLAHGGGERVDVKLIVSEHDDGTVEFRTGVDFSPLGGVSAREKLSADLTAIARLVDGHPLRTTLFRGEMEVPEETRWLSQNTPGFLFVVEAGFVVSLHTLRETDDTKTITHVSFLGRAKNLENL